MTDPVTDGIITPPSQEFPVVKGEPLIISIEPAGEVKLTRRKTNQSSVIQLTVSKDVRVIVNGVLL